MPILLQRGIGPNHNGKVKRQLTYSNISAGNVTVNRVPIIESEVFVYNLGTMYYIDDLLYPEMLESVKQYYDDPTTNAPTTIQVADAERLPADVNESAAPDMHKPEIKNDNSGRPHHTEDDEGDGEIVTPRALPVLYMMTQPQK